LRKYVFTPDMLKPLYENEPSDVIADMVTLTLDWIDLVPSRYYAYFRWGECAFDVGNDSIADALRRMLETTMPNLLWSRYHEGKQEVYRIIVMSWPEYCEERREMFRERYPLESLANAQD
jgi:hypothetical protein